MAPFFTTCCLLLIHALTGVMAQQGSEYVLMYLENPSDGAVSDVELYVASQSAGDISVTIDNPGGSILSSPITFTLLTGTVVMYPLSATARQDSQLDDKAIRVRVNGEGDIVVYALNRNLYSSDGFTVFRIDQNGNEYYAMAYTATENTHIGLIALENGVTEIDITVPAATAVEWEGVQYNTGNVITVRLAYKYQTARVKSIVGDLTGARIISDKKISAFSGNVRASVDGTTRDHLVEQLPPMVQWGFTYYAVRTPNRTADRPDKVRIVAHEDNTNVAIRGGLTRNFVLNSGEFEELDIFSAIHIDSGDKSVMVGVISTSQSRINNADVGDPSMVIMPAVGQYSNNFIFSTPRYLKPPSSDTDEYVIHVLVIAKTSEVSGLRLSGNSIGNQAWSVIAGTAYSTAQILVNNDQSYRLDHPNSDVRFMALLYGYADRESFYFPIDVGMANINVITPVTVVGNKGEQGSRGLRGTIGATGQKGVRGATGGIGAGGSRGNVGQKGVAGIPGSFSAAGATGASGVSGNGGADGPDGFIGLPGAAGTAGATGSTGSAGRRGVKGTKGNRGVIGEQGEDGNTGSPGVRGVQGWKGLKGVSGPVGPLGPAGQMGPKGFVDEGSCVDQCGVLDSLAPATCSITFGTVSHLCSCPPGFQLTESNPNLCIDVDECALELCSHGCSNNVGSYQCSCPDGYELTGNNCVDMDECSNNPQLCGTDNVCINGIGSHLCLPSSIPEPQVSYVGLQVLYQPGFFVFILVLLILITIFLTITAVSLLIRHRNRKPVKRERVVRVEQLQNYDTPIAVGRRYYN